MKSTLVLACLLTTAATAAMSGPIEDQIRFRQSAYALINWNAQKIKRQVIDKPESYDREQIAAAANAIAAIANSGLGSLYGAGTDKGTGWKPTRLKSEFFQKPGEARQLAIDFNREANELARVAATSDANAVKAQFAKLSETCKSCHNSFRAKD